MPHDTELLVSYNVTAAAAGNVASDEIRPSAFVSLCSCDADCVAVNRKVNVRLAVTCTVLLMYVV